MLIRSALVPLLAAMMLLFAQCAPASTSDKSDTKTETEKPITIKLMTSLPIIWGEGGSMQDILSGDSQPAPIYRHWRDRYEMQPVDSLEGLSNEATDLVLLVQPRAMAPADLADLDDWIRKGGNAIIMTDPDLVWPSELPLGDPRRPLSSGLLSPLLNHWGLELVSQDNADALIELEYADHKIATVGVGGFEPLIGKIKEKVACSFSEAGFIAQCQIDKGRVILVADADFLHEELWDDNTNWQDRGESSAMRFTDSLIDQFYPVSND